MNKLLLIAILSLAISSGKAQSQTSFLDKEDLIFLNGLLQDVLKNSLIKPGEVISDHFGANNTGGNLIRPGGGDCYPAFWIRDYAMSLDCGLITAEDQLHMLLLTASTQCDQSWITKGGSLVPFGAVADHIRIDDSRPVYYPGTYSYEEQGTETWGKVPPYCDQFFFIRMAYYYVTTTKDREILTNDIEGFRLIDRLEFAFKVPPVTLDNELVYTNDNFRGVDFGFRDAIFITGNLCIASVYKYRAANEMAQLFDLLENKKKAAAYREIAAGIKAAIPTVFRHENGLLRASTEKSSQPDVWSSALAVYFGILEDEAARQVGTTLAHAYQNGTLAYKGNIRHVLTTDDFNEETMWEATFVTKNTYQNGSYWGTPTGWVCYAISKVNPQQARSLAKEYINDLKETDFRKGNAFGGPYECFHPLGNYTQNPQYLTTVSCPFAVFQNP